MVGFSSEVVVTVLLFCGSFGSVEEPGASGALVARPLTRSREAAAARRRRTLNRLQPGRR